MIDKIQIKKKLYLSNKLRSTTPYKGFVIHGTVVEYREDGRISKETPYVNGKVHGMKIYYHSNGNKLYEYPYIHGKIVGIVKEYYLSGNIVRETEYKRDNPNGLENYYSEDSVLLRETTYKDGIKHGPMRNYSKKGNLLRLINFSNGLIGDTEIQHYSEDGMLEMSFKSEIKEFPSKEYDGDTTYKCYASRKEPNGEWKIYSRCRPIDEDVYKCGFYTEDFFH